MSGKRGYPLECAAAQVCREAGARVITNMFVRDMDLADFNALDNRRLEVVVADGLTLWRGAQLQWTRLSCHRCAVSAQQAKSSSPRRGSVGSSSKRKEDTYPELTGEGGRARLVVLVAAEVGGRWSSETVQFLCSLAKARAQSTPLVLQGRMESAWLRRWSAILACSAARSFALSLSAGPLPVTRDR